MDGVAQEPQVFAAYLFIFRVDRHDRFRRVPADYPLDFLERREEYSQRGDAVAFGRIKISFGY